MSLLRIFPLTLLSRKTCNFSVSLQLDVVRLQLNTVFSDTEKTQAISATVIPAVRRTQTAVLRSRLLLFGLQSTLTTPLPMIGEERRSPRNKAANTLENA